MKYRKKPVVIEADRWFQNGDHPEDNHKKGTIKEGEVVRYYRHPENSGKNVCKYCGYIMHDHGWIDTLEDGHVVCPGDWIIKDIKGEFYPCKPNIFEATYKRVNETK